MLVPVFHGERPASAGVFTCVHQKSSQRQKFTTETQRHGETEENAVLDNE